MEGGLQLGTLKNGAMLCMTAGEQLEEGKYLFGLDPQLLADTILLAVAVFILFIILSYLLFNPARELLEKRKQKIRDDIDSAEKDKEEALALKSEYDAKLAEVDKEVDIILADARKKAKAQENKIIDEAKEEAARIIQRANQEIELEKKHALDDMKTEMVQIAAAMAQKVVAASIDTNISDSLIDETLKEMGDKTWQS